MPTRSSIQSFTHLEYQRSEELCFPFCVLDASRSEHKSSLLRTSKVDLNRSIVRFPTVWHVNLKVENGILHRLVSLVIKRAFP